MVVHQHPRAEDPAACLQSLLQGHDKAPSIVFVQDNFAAPVAAGHGVTDRARIPDSSLPWHLPGC